jgi:hypothetical protein
LTPLLVISVCPVVIEVHTFESTVQLKGTQKQKESTDVNRIQVPQKDD